ncbi:dihydropteroate synthase [Morganella morganii]|uniref:dihydropteroate synthase n=1 Tax=Morganella morganii TaxID=582 RepID=UPI00140F0939
MLRSRVTVFGILNLTEDSFFDESRRLARRCHRAMKCCESDQTVVDVGPAASHPDARPDRRRSDVLRRS